MKKRFGILSLALLMTTAACSSVSTAPKAPQDPLDQYPTKRSVTPRTAQPSRPVIGAPRLGGR